MIFCKKYNHIFLNLHAHLSGVFLSLKTGQMICHKIHICNIYGLHEFHGYATYASSKKLLEKMICHKAHICNFYGYHELFLCVSSNYLLG